MEWLSGDYTLTLFNKLSAKDNPSKKDIWHRTVLHGCVWVNRVNRAVSVTESVVGHTTICRIPKSSNYAPYNSWKEDPQNLFTLRAGDYIILGDIQDSLADNSMVSIVSKYKTDSMQIGAFKDNSNIGFLNHYRVEGV